MPKLLSFFLMGASKRQIIWRKAYRGCLNRLLPQWSGAPGEASFWEKAWEASDRGEVYWDRDRGWAVLLDHLNHCQDIQEFLENFRHGFPREGRLVINIHNNLWRPLFSLAARLGVRAPKKAENWISTNDLKNLLSLSGWEMVRAESKILVPRSFAGFGDAVNRWMAPLLPWLCLTQVFVARPKPLLQEPDTPPSVSIIIPARNEAGNIRHAIQRMPDLSPNQEILFIEGHSSDKTWETIQEVIQSFPDKNIRAYQQEGKGKGDAMRLGYEKATGDVLMILDADLTVPPEDLPKFYRAVTTGLADFANGVRLVYPMEGEAMRFLNLCGNKFFSLLFSWLLHHPIKDTLCGTKVFWKKDYHRIAANRSYFGDFDPFGDFDLIFGAHRLNLLIRDVPVRYRNRTYGEPQIDRWRDGMLLLRMAWFAARKIKFIG